MNEFDRSQHGPGQKMSVTLQSQFSVPSFKNQEGLVDHVAAAVFPGVGYLLAGSMTVLDPWGKMPQLIWLAIDVAGTPHSCLASGPMASTGNKTG